MLLMVPFSPCPSSAIVLGLQFVFPLEVTKKCSAATSPTPPLFRWNVLVTVLGDFRWKVDLTIRWYTRIAFTTHRSTRCSTRIVFLKTNSIYSSRFRHLFACLMFKFIFSYQQFVRPHSIWLKTWNYKISRYHVIIILYLHRTSCVVFKFYKKRPVYLPEDGSRIKSQWSFSLKSSSFIISWVTACTVTAEMLFVITVTGSACM